MRDTPIIRMPKHVRKPTLPTPVNILDSKIKFLELM